MKIRVSGFNIRRFARVGLVLALMASAARAETTGYDVPKEPPIGLPSLSPMVKRVQPAVVNIIAEVAADGAEDGAAQTDETPFDEFMRRYFERHGAPPGAAAPSSAPSTATPKAAGQKQMALGSGFIIDPAGYVVTNNHVIAHAAKITVILHDNSRHEAKLVGADPKTDVALLKIIPKRKLPALVWGDSDRVEVGDWVMAVGNPYGLGGTVTAGIVSALGRDIQQGPFDDFLQIDAPINRGSSGGPTFDAYGRVVGINTAIYSPSGGSIGIGFAIPSRIARAVVQQLRDKGHADHGYLGVTVQVIGPDLARALRADPEKPQGVIVVGVEPDSPAAQAGLQSGDIIRAADGVPTQAPHDVSRLVAMARIGEKLTMNIDRDGKPLTLTLVLARAPDATGSAAPADAAAPNCMSRLRFKAR